MLDGLRSVTGGDSALPFVLQFYGNPSSYLWEGSNASAGPAPPLPPPPPPPNKNNVDRVWVKASRAEGPRRLHPNTAYAHLWGLAGLSAEHCPPEGRQCSAERSVEGPKVGV